MAVRASDIETRRFRTATTVTVTMPPMDTGRSGLPSCTARECKGVVNGSLARRKRPLAGGEQPAVGARRRYGAQHAGAAWAVRIALPAARLLPAEDRSATDAHHPAASCDTAPRRPAGISQSAVTAPGPRCGLARSSTDGGAGRSQIVGGIQLAGFESVCAADRRRRRRFLAPHLDVVQNCRRRSSPPKSPARRHPVRSSHAGAGAAESRGALKPPLRGHRRSGPSPPAQPRRVRATPRPGRRTLTSRLPARRSESGRQPAGRGAPPISRT